MPENSNLNDSPTRAPESGDPQEAGRSHGEVIDQQGAGAGKDEETDRIARKPGEEDYESGRQQATP